ncbi:MAG: EAL domain-containing protein (putative c-di-GMP-specific phosphodiesterase class I) [Phenylobacterium sp.]|jgi:EAL domain-containing protein (putative c-di-GMP-specific phosphodiesterase class I)
MSIIPARDDSALLDHIINERQITSVFQPIFNIQQRNILGYEALSRGPQGTPLHSPEKLFAAARAHGRLSELELLCRKQAITYFVALNLPGKLFLNVSPEVLLDAEHPRGETVQLLHLLGLPCDRVVIEITEQQRADEALLKQAVNHYRELGFIIAIDDLGSGHSGLRQWSELMPDIIKIDRYFVDNCHRDVVKKEFLKFIFALASATGALVIAEGIEQDAELQLLASLGISLTQGFLLEKPKEEPVQVFPAHIDVAAALDKLDSQAVLM